MMKVLNLESWAGRRSYRVTVIGETKTKYRIVAMQDIRLPGKRYLREGEVALVPKYAVTDGKASEDTLYPGCAYGYHPLKRSALA